MASSPSSGPQERLVRNRRKVQEHRQRLRAQGLRPIQVWVPDVRLPDFVREARRQCALANASVHEVDDQAFIDAITDWTDTEAER